MRCAQAAALRALAQLHAAAAPCDAPRLLRGGAALGGAAAGLASALAALPQPPPQPGWDEAAGYPLSLVPRGARRPSALRRSAPRRAAAALALLCLAAWLRRRAASGELRRWAEGAGSALRGALREHVATPLRAVADELFTTLRSRQAGLVSEEALLRSRQSVERQLAAFAERHGGGDGAEGLSASERHLEALYHYQEAASRRPLASLLSGDLGWALLIQVAKAKADGEAAMRQLDQLLRANELTIALVAALPSILIAALGLRGGARLLAWLGRRPESAEPPRARRELRRRFADAQRLLLAAAQAGAEGEAARGALLFALDCCCYSGAALLAPAAAGARGEAARAVQQALGRGAGAREAGAEWEALQTELRAMADGEAAPGDRLARAELAGRSLSVLSPAPQ